MTHPVEDFGATVLDIRADIERSPWTEAEAPRAKSGRLTSVGLLRAGTTTGRASIALLVQLPDGSTVIAQTTWRAFNAAARALAASPLAQAEPE